MARGVRGVEQVQNSTGGGENLAGRHASRLSDMGTAFVQHNRCAAIVQLGTIVRQESPNVAINSLVRARQGGEESAVNCPVCHGVPEVRRERLPEGHDELVKVFERARGGDEVGPGDARDAVGVRLVVGITTVLLGLVPAVEEFDLRQKHGRLDVEYERVNLIFVLCLDDMEVVRPLAILRGNQNLRILQSKSSGDSGHTHPLFELVTANRQHLANILVVQECGEAVDRCEMALRHVR